MANIGEVAEAILADEVYGGYPEDAGDALGMPKHAAAAAALGMPVNIDIAAAALGLPVDMIVIWYSLLGLLSWYYITY